MKAKLARAAVALAGALAAPQAWADRVWIWSYTGTDIQASGTFTTTDTADADGFSEITPITGTRNGDAITGLYPSGLAIRGNGPASIALLLADGARRRAA